MESLHPKSVTTLSNRIMVMKKVSAAFLSILGLGGLVSGCQQADLTNEAKAATPMVKASAENPVIVELYQSQGCSSCPPADLALNAVADRDDVIALNFSVTYWDRLGWKDIFGDPAYTQRQYDYAHAFKNPNVYTPQMIINGTRPFVGNRKGELDRELAASKAVSGGPAISAANGKVTIGAGSGKANVWLVRYDPRIQNVAVKAGENAGRTIPHKNIVRQLVKLGAWDGKEAGFTLPKSPASHYKSVLIVQRPASGPIIAARKI